MKAAQDRQKSYAYQKKRHKEYEVEKHVYIKVSPVRGLKRFF